MTNNATYALLMQVIEDEHIPRERLKQWRRRRVPLDIQAKVLFRAGKFGVNPDYSVFSNLRSAECDAKKAEAA